MRIAAIFALLLLASPAFGQQLDLKAGDSTLLNSGGVDCVAYFPGSQAEIGLGISNGHFVLGAADRFQFHGWDVVAGDAPISFYQPGASLGFAARGLTIRKHNDRRTFTAFIGAAGQLYSQPYFMAASGHSFGAGFSLTQKLTDNLEFSTIEVLDGNQKTAAQGLAYRRARFRAEGGGGLLQNKPYAFGDVAALPNRNTTLSAGHNENFYLGERFTVNSAGAGLLAGPASFSINAFEGSSTFGKSSGETFGAGLRFGMVDTTTTYARSKFGAAILTTINEHIGQRFRISQYVADNAGHWTVSAGGGFTSNKFSVDVSYQTFFMPLNVNKSPFQQALTMTFSIHAPHDIALAASTYLLPTGKIRWTTSGETWAHGPIAGGGAGRAEEGHTGKFVIEGVVVDESGSPVSGAAVKIGKDEVFSDSKGKFFAREKKVGNQPLVVALDDFAAAGDWEVVEAPATASTDAPAKIVVKRR